MQEKWWDATDDLAQMLEWCSRREHLDKPGKGQASNRKLACFISACDDQFFHTTGRRMFFSPDAALWLQARHFASGAIMSQATGAEILRDIVHYPLRLVSLQYELKGLLTPSSAGQVSRWKEQGALYLPWVKSEVKRMAQEVYDSADFTALPMLADQLEADGCTVSEILGHLRKPCRHWRGCWALDIVIGKE